MKRNISKRIFALIMTLVMLSATWVFVVPASAEACEMGGEHIPVITKEAQAPTCTEDGWTSESTCRKCNSIISKSTVLKKTGHNYDRWIIDEAPTYIREGHAHIVCLTCNYVYNYTIRAMGGTFDCTEHQFTTGNTENDYVVLIYPTCTSTGIKAHYCVNCNSTDGVEHYVEMPLTPHRYGMTYIRQHATCEDPKISYHICNDCGYEEEMYDGPLDHVFYEWEHTFLGTCQEKAYDTRTCDRCQKTETRELDQYGPHTYVDDPYVAPTCLSTGISFGRHCTTCGYKEIVQKELPMLPHVDLDKDLICDLCKITPVDCSCLCHNTDGIRGFVAKIVIFIWKLLGIQRKCACGIDHYFVYKPIETTP